MIDQNPTVPHHRMRLLSNLFHILVLSFFSPVRPQRRCPKMQQPLDHVRQLMVLRLEVHAQSPHSVQVGFDVVAEVLGGKLNNK